MCVCSGGDEFVVTVVAVAGTAAAAAAGITVAFAS